MEKKIKKIIKELACFTWMLYMIARHYPGKHRLRYAGKNNRTLHILANGPSLKDAISDFEKKTRQGNEDFLMVNFSAFTPEFEKMKPQFYCILDPVFFQASYISEKVQNFYKTINQSVSWPMTIFISSSVSIKDFLLFSKINNSNISVRQICTHEYMGFDRFRNIFYRHGLAMPCAQNISIMAIMIGLNLGYSNINLYGVDHTFLEGARIDGENHVVFHETHFYGAFDRPCRDTDGRYIKFHELLSMFSRTFESHQLCRSYADYLGINILNCTPNSMIDAYERQERI